MVDRLRAAGPTVLGAMAVIYFVWGSTFLAIRIAIDALPPLFMCGARLSLAGLIMAAWAIASRAERPTGRQALHAIAVGLMLPTIGNGAVTLGETRVPSGLVALLVASIPLWMALFAAAGVGGRRARPSMRVLLGLVAGFAGLLLLVGSRPARHDVVVSGAAAVAWALVPIAGSMSWAWGSLWSRTVPLPGSPLWSMALGLVVGGPVLLLASGATGEFARLSPASFTLPATVSVVYLAVLGTVLGLGAYLWLLRRVSPTMVSTYAFVNPIVAMALGGIFLAERPTPLMLAAAALVVLAVATIVTAPPAKPRAQVVSAPLEAASD